jgi:hypothetical protein
MLLSGQHFHSKGVVYMWRVWEIYNHSFAERISVKRPIC